MTLKKAYQYLFYKLYKFYDTDSSMWWSSNWLTDWKAVFSILVLEIWTLLSVIVYYKVFTKRDLIPENIMEEVAIAVVIILAIVKYFAFEHRDRWKDYVTEFNQWPKKKNRIGTLVVWLIVLFILGNLIFAFYLMSQINWQQYK